MTHSHVHYSSTDFGQVQIFILFGLRCNVSCLKGCVTPIQALCMHQYLSFTTASSALHKSHRLLFDRFWPSTNFYFIWSEMQRELFEGMCDPYTSTMHASIPFFYDSQLRSAQEPQITLRQILAKYKFLFYLV